MLVWILYFVCLSLFLVCYCKSSYVLGTPKENEQLYFKMRMGVWENIALAFCIETLKPLEFSTFSRVLNSIWFRH